MSDFLSESMLLLVSKDGLQFYIDKNIARDQCLLFKAHLDSEDESEFILERIDGHILAIIVEFMKKNHVEKLPELKKPFESSILIENCKNESEKPLLQQYVDMINASNLDLLELIILAAQRLEVEPLIEFACAAFIISARGKKRAEIREIWGLPTPDITYDDSGDVIRNDENFKFLSHVE